MLTQRWLVNERTYPGYVLRQIMGRLRRGRAEGQTEKSGRHPGQSGLHLAPSRYHRACTASRLSLTHQPTGAHGTYRYLCDSLDPYSARLVDEFANPNDNALALLESQFLNYRSRSSAILTDSTPTTTNPSSSSQTPQDATQPRLSRVYATGGAAANLAILSLLSDILGAPICKNVEYSSPKSSWVPANWNACSVGVAYKAAWGYERWTHRGSEREWTGFDEFVQECREARAGKRPKESREMGPTGKHGGERAGSIVEEGIMVVAAPGDGAGAYEKVLERWRALEQRALKGN